VSSDAQQCQDRTKKGNRGDGASILRVKDNGAGINEHERDASHDAHQGVERRSGDRIRSDVLKDTNRACYAEHCASNRHIAGHAIVTVQGTNSAAR
jgi:hypothetical protein